MDLPIFAHSTPNTCLWTLPVLTSTYPTDWKSLTLQSCNPACLCCIQLPVSETWGTVTFNFYIDWETTSFPVGTSETIAVHHGENFRMVGGFPSGRTWMTWTHKKICTSSRSKGWKDSRGSKRTALAMMRLCFSGLGMRGGPSEWLHTNCNYHRCEANQLETKGKS